jgi:hypothetical protein
MTLALISLNAQTIINIKAHSRLILTTVESSGGGGEEEPNLGIQGYGANATGASPGDPTYTVTTTSTGTGAGTLYHALFTAVGGTGSATSHKNIDFNIPGGVGTFTSSAYTMTALSYVTINGTGQQITIDANNDGFSFEGSGCHHIIVKNLHFVDCSGDGINVVDGAHDIAITNCSAYGNGDGNMDVGTDCYNITWQYNIIGYHTAPSDDGTGGMLITSPYVSAHHNLFNVKSTEEGERCPLIHGNYSDAFGDIRNNIVYNYGRDNATGSGFGSACLYGDVGAGGYAHANIVNNYYYTPSSSASADGVWVNGDSPGSSIPIGDGYSSGNVSGNGHNFNTGSRYTNHAEWAVDAQYQIDVETACQAVVNVLTYVGPDVKTTVDNTLISQITQLGSCAFNQPKFTPASIYQYQGVSFNGPAFNENSSHTTFIKSPVLYYARRKRANEQIYNS